MEIHCLQCVDISVKEASSTNWSAQLLGTQIAQVVDRGTEMQCAT